MAPILFDIKILSDPGMCSVGANTVFGVDKLDVRLFFFRIQILNRNLYIDESEADQRSEEKR